MEKVNNFLKRKKMYIAAFLLLSSNAMATTADAPWVGMLDKFMGILVGPTARIISILALALLGFAIMAGLTEHLSKKAIGWIAGSTIVFAAASWGPKFLGYSGAVLM
mgnify:CR=1 FL=1